MNLLWRVAIVGFLHVLLHVGIAVLVDPPVLPWAVDTGTEFLTLFGVGVFHSLGVAVLVRASRLRGLWLVGAIALMYVPVYVVFPPVQAELMELPLPDGAKTDYAILSALQTLIWLPLAVWLMARWAGEAPSASVRYRSRLLWLRPLLLAALYLGIRLVAERGMVLQLEPDADWSLVTDRTSMMLWWLLRGGLTSVLVWPWLAGARGAWPWRGLWLGVGMAALEVMGAAPADWPTLALPALVSLGFGMVAAPGWFLGAAPEGPAHDASP